MSDVFISYARSTSRQAQAAAEALRSLGYSVWLDDDLPAHRTYTHVIEEELDRAKAALVIWSAEAVRSEWVMSEANRAREAHKLVQINLDQSRLPMPFDQIQCVDLPGWSGESEAPAWRKAVKGIADLTSASESPQAESREAAPARARATMTLTSEGERRHLTVLSCDLVNAARIAASLDPEEWRAVVTLYQRAAAEAVLSMGGHVAKSLTYGVVAYFGFPEAREDAAERAVRAGLAILESMAALNEQLAAEHKVELAVRAGIHTGTVVVAQGPGKDAEIFGEAPNIASQVQALGTPGAVMMTGAVHDLVAGLFLVEDHGAQPLEGVDEKVRLYRAISSGLASRRTRRFSQREPTAFVGREDEAHLLLSRWERVRDGEGQFVLIMGEPGIGKTRLIEEFGARIKGDPHLWIECAGSPFFANTPFHSLIQMLDQGLGRRGDESPQERVSLLEQGLAPTGMKLGEAVPLILELLDLPIPDKYPPLMISPDQRRKRLLAALAGWVFRTTTNQSLVIAIEDLQWVDPSTMELLQTLVDQAATAPLMLVCTARPEFRAPWPARAHYAQITLNRLNNRQTQEMVAALISRAGLPRNVINAVIKRTDGVPLFAEELTRLMLERGGTSGAHEIPSTLLDSLAARLDRLGRAKEVAQLGSVLGREFSYDLLHAVSPMLEHELQSDLTKLADAELIYARGLPPDARYRFKHALTQDAAYDALLKSQRRELHARVAKTITEQFGALDEAQPEVLARHWTEAGEAAPAITAWKSAGDAAYARRAFTEAEEGYRQALAMLRAQPESPERDARELELCSALNRVLQLTSGYAAPETVEAATRARALAEKSGSIAQLIREEARIWRAVVTAGDYAAATALGDHILELTRGEGDNPSRLVFAHNAQMQTRFYTGDLRGVEEHFERFTAAMDAAGPRQAPGNNIIGIGVASLTAWAMGRAEAAHERMARSMALASASANPYDLAMTLHFQGLLYSCERDVERAEGAATQLLAVSEENGFAYAGDLARSTLGWTRARRGAAAGGVALMRQAWGGLATSGARVGMTYGLTLLAEIQALSGALDDALETIDEALTANPQERVFRSEALRLRGELRLKIGDAAEAQADLLDAVATAEGMGAKAWTLRATTSLARLFRARGDDAAARDRLAPVLAIPTEGLSPADVGEARSLMGQLQA